MRLAKHTDVANRLQQTFRSVEPSKVESSPDILRELLRGQARGKLGSELGLLNDAFRALKFSGSVSEMEDGLAKSRRIRKLMDQRQYEYLKILLDIELLGTQ